MSSKLKPNSSNKKSNKSAERTKLWTIILCVAVLVIATVLILIRMGVFEREEINVAGRYHLTHMTDPSTGVTTPVEQMKKALELVNPGEALIEIMLMEDGTFTFEPNFDLMVRYEGEYELEEHKITMTAKEDTSGPITGTVDGRHLTITDTSGYKMTFRKVD